VERVSGERLAQLVGPKGKVYALDIELEAAAGLTKDQLLEVMEGHVLDEGELVGTYQRK
jgi:phosphatidylethanolamine-binding protein (PEBP) family uncharacterized protein